MMRDLTITSVDMMTAFAITGGAYRFTVDELQNVTISQYEEKTDITGKQGRKLSSLKRNKAVSISGTNGLISVGLMELQTGCEFTNKAVKVLWTDYLTVQSNAATTTWTAVGTSGAEIEALYTIVDGALGTKLEQDSTAASGKFAYAPATKALTFSGITNGTEIMVVYKRNITADVLENKSDSYSEKCVLYIDATAEDKCGNLYHVQFYFPKADFSGEFSIEMGDNQTVHNFDAESLAGACGGAANLWTYVVFGANTEDTAV
jgi:hypothetical protein